MTAIDIALLVGLWHVFAAVGGVAINIAGVLLGFLLDVARCSLSVFVNICLRLFGCLGVIVKAGLAILAVGRILLSVVIVLVLRL